MLIKYKAGDVAKDLGLPNKELLEVVTKKFGEGKKYTTPLTEEELNYVFEHYTREKQVASFDEYLASAPQPLSLIHISGGPLRGKAVRRRHRGRRTAWKKV